MAYHAFAKVKYIRTTYIKWIYRQGSNAKKNNYNPFISHTYTATTKYGNDSTITIYSVVANMF